VSLFSSSPCNPRAFRDPWLAVLPAKPSEREIFIDNLLVRVHIIIVMSRWTGLAPWEFEIPFSGSLTPIFLDLSRTSPPRAVTLTVFGVRYVVRTSVEWERNTFNGFKDFHLKNG